MRTLAIDLGDVRIGFAQTDPMEIIATGLESYKRKTLKEDIDHIVDIVKNNQVGKIVIGLPLNMDGTEGPRVEKTKEFVAQLQQAVDVEIIMQDERLTTVSAEEVLIESGMRREKRKDYIDKVAATIILQSYLNSKR